jgi:hypothetical protein
MQTTGAFANLVEVRQTWTISSLYAEIFRIYLRKPFYRVSQAPLTSIKIPEMEYKGTINEDANVCPRGKVLR